MYGSDRIMQGKRDKDREMESVRDRENREDRENRGNRRENERMIVGLPVRQTGTDANLSYNESRIKL